MIKNCCSMCGVEIRMGIDLCSDCQQARDKAKKATSDISKACEAIVKALEEKGSEVVAQTNLFKSELVSDISERIKKFESKVKADLEGQAQKIMSDYFSTLEAERKEVKAIGEQ